MATIAPDTPAAQALSNAVHAKLVEEGWTQDDDTSLAEYIVLMLANGKTQDQIASELAGELLQDATGTTEFAQWLFQQVDRMQEASQQSEKPVTQEQSSSDQVHAENPIPAAYEMDMADSAPENAPRGPKGLHGGRPQTNRGRGSMSNKGGDSALHRTRGNDRINSHANLRGAPKGPRSSQDRGARPGMQKALNSMGLVNVPGMQNPMMLNGGQSQQTPMQMSPQQQMEFMAMMEQQTRMMAQLTGMMPGGNGVFPQGGAQQNGHGRSLFDRVEPSRGRGGTRGRGRGASSQNGHVKGPTKTGDNDTAMEGDEQSTDAPAMDVDQSAGQPKQDAANTMCHFNLRCTNKDCPYVHQSPAAPPGTVVDMSDTCTFGSSCKNPKCAGKHPSPAQIKASQAQEICKFFPNCTRPNCPYKHPNTPLCRFGSNCKTPNCQFTHLEIPCHFNPCTNMRCPYKHNPGQQKATSLADYTWTPDKQSQTDQAALAASGDHVSDRRFVDENAGEEELVKPEATTGNGEGVVT